MVFEEVLAIQVGLKGIESIKAGFEAIAQGAKVAEASAKAAAAGFAQLGISIGIGLAGIREAMGEERSATQLKALVDNAKTAETVIKQIQSTASKGVFGEDEIWGAALAMERAGLKAKEWLGTAYNISGRAGTPGSLQGIAEIMSRINAGDTQMLKRPLRSMGIYESTLQRYGVQDMDKATPQQLLYAFKEIGKEREKFTKATEGTFFAKWTAELWQFKEALKPMGENLMKVFGPVLAATTQILKTITMLDKATGGWASTIMVGLVAFNGIAKILPAVLSITRTLLTLEIARAAWTKMIAIFSAIAAFAQTPMGWAAIGLLAGVGVAIGATAMSGGFGGGGSASSTSGTSSSTGSSSRKTGIRRADFDNFMGARLADALG